MQNFELQFQWAAPTTRKYVGSKKTHQNSFYENRQYSKSSPFHRTKKALLNTTPLFMFKLNETLTYDVHVLILNFFVDANNVHECGPCRKDKQTNNLWANANVRIGKNNLLIFSTSSSTPTGRLLLFAHAHHTLMNWNFCSLVWCWCWMQTCKLALFALHVSTLSLSHGWCRCVYFLLLPPSANCLFFLLFFMPIYVAKKQD